VRNTPLEALFVVALHTGMRRGELLGLTWGCVDFSRRLLHVQQGLQRIGGVLTLGELKTDKSRRTLAMTEGVHEVLMKQKARQEALGFNTDFVFNGLRRGPVDPSTLSRHYKAALKEAGLWDMRFHDLRHGTASLLLESGVNLKIVSELLGHSSVSITADLYSHVNESMMRAVRSMDQVMGK
jgi:integrase